MSDDNTSTTSDNDAQAEQALADAAQDAGTATDTEQSAGTTASGDTQQPTEAESKFDATRWAAMFGDQDPAEVKRRLEHSRTWEKRAKENSKAAAEYQKYLDSQKTEQERLAEAKEAAERELTDLRSANARLMAAATHNLPPELIDLLGTGTEDEIDARAALLAEKLAAAAPPPAPPAAEPERRAPAQTRPVESLTAGAKPATERPADMDAILRGMAGRT